MSTAPVDPWTGHNHPQTEACASGCPKAPQTGDTQVDNEVDSPASNTESSQVSGASEGDKATDIKEAVNKVAKRTPPRRGNNRRSGKPAATEEGEKSADNATSEPQSEDLDVEREEWFRNPGFQRMKTSWSGDDKAQMDRVQAVIDRVVLETFQDAYAVMSDIYDLVREEEHDPVTGEARLDPLGFKIWAKNPLTGAYYEDWSLLTTREREHFLFRITTALFDWEQRAADLWTKAMFSKGMFVEKFSIEYDSPIHGTIDDRNARGNKEAAEDRYFALMNSAISRKADAIVRAMTNLQLRLKDTLGQ